MSDKPLPKPNWLKNTYFWIGGLLLVVTAFGLVQGDAAVRDPGQKHESSLWIFYLLAAVFMIVNGLISHNQTVQAYNEQPNTTVTNQED